MQKKLKTLISTYLWALPFASFIIGYALAHIFFSSPRITVPNIVGNSLSEGAKQASERHLNIRILTEKEDADLTPGTILHQKPGADKKVKPYHALYVIVSKKPSRKKVPLLVGKELQATKDILDRDNIKYKIFSVPSKLSKNSIIGQQPHAQEDIAGPIHIYIASPTKNEVIFPKLTGLTIEEVQEFLNNHHIPYSINQKQKAHHLAQKIKEQRPLPGSIISLEEPPHIQLLV